MINITDYPERRPLASERHDEWEGQLQEDATKLGELIREMGQAAKEAVPSGAPDGRLHARTVFLTKYPHLGGEEVFRTRTDESTEAIILVLTGQVAVTLDYDDDGGIFRQENHVLGGRQSVFNGMPSAVVMAPNTRVTLMPVTDAAEVVVAGTGIDAHAHASRTRAVLPSDVRVHQVGEGHFKREVREVVGETQNLTTRLFCGETRQMPGTWSSWPHHEFDRHPELAQQFDEVFYVYAQPLLPTIRDSEIFLRRKGLMHDGSHVDDMLVLKSGDHVRVPLGHHPICAPLDAGLVYVWFYVSPRELVKRYAKRAVDGGYYA